MAKDLGEMRLICPNCGAQYEVPTEVVPEAGRDVQCSNCGHTWFQHHPDHAPAELAEPVPEDVREDEDEDWEAPGPEETPEEPPAPPAAEAEQEPADPAPAAAQAAARRGLDPSVAEVLREEAEREAQARRGAAGSLESQPDLGLDSSTESDEERRARQARERMARMRGAESAPEAETPVAESEPEPTAKSRAQTAAASRGDMLPDIDEINQTLRATSERRPMETPQGRAPDDEDAGGGGFARGLSLTVLAASLLLALYVFAAPLAELAPSLAPLLDAYVAQANDLRVWLQATLGGLLGDAGAASGA